MVKLERVSVARVGAESRERAEGNGQVSKKKRDMAREERLQRMRRRGKAGDEVRQYRGRVVCGMSGQEAVRGVDEGAGAQEEAGVRATTAGDVPISG